MKKTRTQLSYEAYKRLYRSAQRKMRKRGMEMNDSMLNKREFIHNRKMVADELASEGKATTNATSRLVSQQQYKYDYDTGRRFLTTARKHGLDWDESLLREIRAGKIDVSTINDQLKIQQPKWTGKERARYISHEVFGSD